MKKVSHEIDLVYALKDGAITHISQVESGLICGCICPACGERLVAKKGSKVRHHFAHYSVTSCEYGYETMLHYMAKDILSKEKKMTIPAVYVVFQSYKDDELISEAKQVTIESVELEKRCGDIIPDIVVHTGGRIFFVEIFVTHKIDDEKLGKIKKAGISTIEIDLSGQSESISEEELKELLVNDHAEKQWKYNRVSEEYYNKFASLADRKKKVGWVDSRVYNCPINSRIWRGMSYAYYAADCMNCSYCISGGETVLCTGRKKIETISDLKNYLNKNKLK